MKFKLLHKDLEKLKNFEYEVHEVNLDNIDSYIDEMRNILLESKNVTFELTCLGEDWNVDVYDFTLFTEHLLDIYQLCDKEVDVSYLMWYVEQGINREILFTKIDDEIIKIQNHPRTHPSSELEWISPLPYEDITISALKLECENFVKSIKEVIDILCPEFNDEEIVKDWYQKFGL